MQLKHKVQVVNAPLAPALFAPSVGDFYPFLHFPARFVTSFFLDLLFGLGLSWKQIGFLSCKKSCVESRKKIVLTGFKSDKDLQGRIIRESLEKLKDFFAKQYSQMALYTLSLYLVYKRIKLASSGESP